MLGIEISVMRQHTVWCILCTLLEKKIRFNWVLDGTLHS